ncbi:unnamed protein product [Cyclocybe aegerita]|uniref:BTB domain-containing protein n=1 Tax=Cyclocybe aegerita TaxID=1973307 RepID=A0A8S0VUV9_CYCAE|nr:unnamed protein product [Cyclocybe aegerita]
MSSSRHSHHETYYLTDGNVVLSLSGTLFKVHRSVLARDGSTFENMFSLEEYSLVQEGCSDENPIHLQGDSVEEFQELLWCLYALPQEISLASSPQGDITKLSNAARMAHKYHFITTETWALRALLACLASQRSAGLSTHSLVKATEVAVLCDDIPLSDAVRIRWKVHIAARTDLAIVMKTTDRLAGMRDLQGQAYHAMMLQGRHRWDTDKDLSRHQRVRLLSGYHNLTQVCDALPDTPPEIGHDASCRYRGECHEAWKMLWKQMTNPNPNDGGIGSQAFVHHHLDLPGRLMMTVSVMKAFVEGTIPKYDEIMDNFHRECSFVALEATAALFRRTQENMMEFFADVT